MRKSSSKILETIPENAAKKEDEKNDVTSVDSEHLVYFVDNVPLEKILKETLDSLGIVNAVWTLAKEGKFHEISFPCEPGYKCDLILRALITKGIGFRGGSTIGVMPCAIFYQDVDENEGENSNEGSDAESDGGSEESTKWKTEKKGRSISKSVQHKFLKSVTSRLTVAQVVEGVRANANLNFDFVMFTILASIIAAVGLVESSSVILVASMLISPLMGPILAGTFGTVIQDGPLRNLGIKTEILGLLLCILFGFLFGLISGPFSNQWVQGDWPTKEMTSRGELRSLWLGVLVALPSGAGVALSVLGGNAGSLVGVAISASLLPPAVNAVKYFKKISISIKLIE
ncbi:uncharacterized protein LOC111623946 [Centruroides sculpturatus]|uniref:uncharacterized protein LOC111623946 n=1 Tax=Centruroides sculpturatus TaxID=218467 RepID=UPI000C6D1B5A|nr:uncharacterized protein LOC111623946 [Centruroides sculpturatus]